MVFETKEQAATTFINEIQAPNSELANIKDTLSIFAIGEYEHKKGTIHPYLFGKKTILHGTEVTIQPNLSSAKGYTLKEFNNSINPDSHKGE